MAYASDISWIPDKHSLRWNYGTKIAAHSGIMNTFFKSRRIKAQKGFSIVELIIVMTLAGILALLSYFGVQSILPGYRLNGAARMVRGDLYNAKMLATKRNLQYRVVFNAGNKVNSSNDYELQRGTTSSGAFSLDQVELSRTFSDYPGVTLNSATADPVFSPRGTASSVTITLENTEGKTKTITTSIAGRIKIN